MEVVLDANILVAAFLRSATTRELLLDKRLSCWTPEYGLTEVERVLLAPRLRRRLGGLSPTDVRLVLNEVTANVRVLPASLFRERLPDALALAPHPEDAPYLALALHLNFPLWSNDEDLKGQAAVQILTTPELLDLLHGHSQ